MAYIKTHVDKRGFEGNYWRITEATLNKVRNIVTIKVSLYKDKAFRLAGGGAMEHKTFYIPTTAIDLSKDLIEECYKAIKDLKCNEDKFKPQAVALFSSATID